MKTVSINLYNYSELSDDAKKVVLDKFNETNNQYYRTTEEFLKSAKKFLKLIDPSLRVYDYQLGPYTYNYIRFSTNDYDADCLLVRNSNVIENLLSIPAIKDVFDNYNNYPLTGNYTDDALCTQLHKMITSTNFDYDICTIIEHCLDELCGQCVTQCENDLSEEYFIDYIESNYEEDEQPLYRITGELYDSEVQLATIRKIIDDNLYYYKDKVMESLPKLDLQIPTANVANSNCSSKLDVIHYENSYLVIYKAKQIGLGRKTGIDLFGQELLDNCDYMITTSFSSDGTAWIYSLERDDVNKKWIPLYNGYDLLANMHKTYQEAINYIESFIHD